MYITLQNVKFINSGLFLLGLEKWYRHSIYIRTVSSELFFSFGAFDFFLAGLECKMHVVLPKQPINKLKLIQQSRQQVLEAYCPDKYTVVVG